MKIIAERLQELNKMKAELIEKGDFNRIKPIDELIHINKVWLGEEPCLFTHQREAK